MNFLYSYCKSVLSVSVQTSALLRIVVATIVLYDTLAWGVTPSLFNFLRSDGPFPVELAQIYSAGFSWYYVTYGNAFQQLLLLAQAALAVAVIRFSNGILLFLLWASVTSFHNRVRVVTSSGDDVLRMILLGLVLDESWNKTCAQTKAKRWRSTIMPTILIPQFICASYRHGPAYSTYTTLCHLSPSFAGYILHWITDPNQSCNGFSFFEWALWNSTYWAPLICLLVPATRGVLVPVLVVANVLLGLLVRLDWIPWVFSLSLLSLYPELKRHKGTGPSMQTHPSMSTSTKADSLKLCALRACAITIVGVIVVHWICLMGGIRLPNQLRPPVAVLSLDATFSIPVLDGINGNPVSIETRLSIPTTLTNNSTVDCWRDYPQGRPFVTDEEFASGWHTKIENYVVQLVRSTELQQYLGSSVCKYYNARRHYGTLLLHELEQRQRWKLPQSPPTASSEPLSLIGAKHLQIIASVTEKLGRKERIVMWNHYCTDNSRPPDWPE